MTVPAMAASATLTARAASASLPAAVASVPGSINVVHHDWGSIFSADYFFANPQAAGSLLSVVGSALVGLLTLFGVGITLWVNRDGLRKQLKAAEQEAQRNRDFNVRQASDDREHSRKEAAIDRENSANQEHVARLMEMRKVLYQTLIEEHQKAVSAIASLSNIPSAEISDAPIKLLGYAAAAQKTMIISEGPTSVAAIDAHGRVNEFMFSLLPKLIPLAVARAEYDNEAKKLAQQNELFTAQTTEFQTLMPGDSNALERFTFKATKSAEAFESISAQLQKLGTKRNALLAEYQEHMMGQLPDVHRTFARFLVLARGELGLAGGAEELLLQTESMLSRVAAAMAKFKSDLAAMQT